MVAVFTCVAGADGLVLKGTGIMLQLALALAVLSPSNALRAQNAQPQHRACTPGCVLAERRGDGCSQPCPHCPTPCRQAQRPCQTAPTHPTHQPSCFPTPPLPHTHLWVDLQVGVLGDAGVVVEGPELLQPIQAVVPLVVLWGKARGAAGYGEGEERGGGVERRRNLLKPGRRGRPLTCCMVAWRCGPHRCCQRAQAVTRVLA
jgi:hypothetical protein